MDKMTTIATISPIMPSLTVRRDRVVEPAAVEEGNSVVRGGEVSCSVMRVTIRLCCGIGEIKPEPMVVFNHLHHRVTGWYHALSIIRTGWVQASIVFWWFYG